MAKDTKETASFQEIMHMAVTAAVVLLSIASLVCLIAAGCREKALRGTGIRAAAESLRCQHAWITMGSLTAEEYIDFPKCNDLGSRY